MRLIKRIVAGATVAAIGFALPGCVGSGGGTGSNGVDPGFISGVYKGTFGSDTFIMEMQQTGVAPATALGHLRPSSASGPACFGGWVLKDSNGKILAVGALDTTNVDATSTSLGIEAGSFRSDGTNFVGTFTIDYNAIGQVIGLHASDLDEGGLFSGDVNLDRIEECQKGKSSLLGTYSGTGSANGQTIPVNATISSSGFPADYNSYSGEVGTSAFSGFITVKAQLIDGTMYFTTVPANNQIANQVKPMGDQSSWSGFLQGEVTYGDGGLARINGTVQGDVDMNPQSGTFDITEED